MVDQVYAPPPTRDGRTGQVTNVNQSLFGRMIDGLRYTISGVAPDAWMSPLQPLAPSASPAPTGRLWNTPAGYNLNINPRPYDQEAFVTLRALAESCDIIRLLIEKRKDQIVSLPWVIKPKEKHVQGDEKKIKELTMFFNRPDQRHTWEQWIRMLLEDMLVIDAATVYRQKNKGGKIIGYEPMDGSTLCVKIDDQGRVPMAPDPAYQQILQATPAVDYTTDEIIYMPRNVRTYDVYGYSPVEQIITTINIMIRRLTGQLNYYDASNIPAGFLNLPSDWNQDQLNVFMLGIDSRLGGNFFQRSKMLGVPAETKFTEVKPAPLVEEFTEEWFTRVACFAFGVSPQPFVKDMNKGTAKTSYDTAMAEGLTPVQLWIKGFMDLMIQSDLGYADLEFEWQDDREQDPEVAMRTQTGYRAASVISVNEVRSKLGEKPLESEEANDPLWQPTAAPVFGMGSEFETGAPESSPIENSGIKAQDAALNGAQMTALQSICQSVADGNLPRETAIQLIMISIPSIDIKEATRLIGPTENFVPASVEREEQQKEQEAVIAREALNQDKGKKQDEAAAKAYSNLEKGVRRKRPIPFNRATVRAARTEMKREIYAVFRKVAASVAMQYRGNIDGKMAKKEFDLSGLTVIAEVSQPILKRIARDAGNRAMDAMPIDLPQLVNIVDEDAVAFSRERAAELVGMRYEGNDLVPNPNAKWRIDEPTRDELRRIIADGLEENIGRDAIADLIEASFAFSEERAEIIASTEIARANTAGNLNSYYAAKEAGVNIKKAWFPDADACPICEANGAQGPIDLDDDFDSGDDGPPAHPNCECSIIPIVEDEG